MAESASLNWIAWWDEISSPKVLRTLAYSVARASAQCAVPTARPALCMRPRDTPIRARLSPAPSSPTTDESGTNTSVQLRMARVPADLAEQLDHARDLDAIGVHRHEEGRDAALPGGPRDIVGDGEHQRV